MAGSNLKSYGKLRAEAKPIKFQIPEILHERIKATADENNLSPSELIRFRLYTYLNGQTKLTHVSKNKQISVQLDEKMRAKLKAKAVELGVDFRSLIFEILKEWDLDRVGMNERRKRKKNENLSVE